MQIFIHYSHLSLFQLFLFILPARILFADVLHTIAKSDQEKIEKSMAAFLATLCVLLSLQQALGEQSFNPVEWSMQTSSSSQCGAGYSYDLTSAITTVAQMITDSIDYIPRSCLEVKNGSPESPSGYYTLMNDTSGVSSIVYCDMDNLNTCPALEQTLTGLMNNYQSLTNYVSGLTTNYDALDTAVFGLEGDYGDLSASVSGLTSSYNTLISSVSDVLTGITDLQTGIDAFQMNDDITSCEDIKNKWPWATSGWYEISSEAVYCYMGERCSTAGPWRRVLYLDMTDPSQTCPKNFRIYSSNGVRTCGRPSGDGGCVDTVSPTSSLSYSKICGRVIGYQWGSPDGLQGGTIDGVYVDGVSLTRGNPRQHVWTFINSYNDEVSQCPCSGGNSNPSFIGNDYTCESGLTGSWSQILYTDDPIWDGLGCNSAETDCCSLANVPWFYKDLGSATTDYLELRTCGNQHTDDEDTTLEIYEIYVQ